MNTLIIALIWALSVAGTWIGSDAVTKNQLAKIPPKTIVHDTKVVVDSKTTSQADANAYSITILKDGQMFKQLTIATVGTNFTVSVTSNKKETWKTNNTATNR